MLCIDRRYVCIVGFLISGYLATKCPFVDVCLNKWTHSRKVLVGVWFDDENCSVRNGAFAAIS